MINYHMISLKDDDDVIKNDSKLYPQLFRNKHCMMNKHNSSYIKKDLSKELQSDSHLQTKLVDLLQ